MSSHLVPRPILQLEDIEGLGYGDDPSASRFGEARIMAAKNVRRKNSLTASRDSSMRIGCSPTPSGLEKDCVEASSGYGMPARVQREVHLESPHRQRCVLTCKSHQSARVLLKSVPTVLCEFM